MNPIPKLQRTPKYVPVVDGIRLYHLGLYETRRAALAQIVGRLGDAEKVWIATEKR